MATPTGMPSKEKVNKAGVRLGEWWSNYSLEIPEPELKELIFTVLEWRAQHAYPMSLAMPSLRKWSDRYSTSGVQPSQRLKRMPQILNKLERHPGMKLARMQDIGGTRAVLANRDEVERVHAKILRYWEVDRVKDWRDAGRPDTGYRALHLMVLKKDNISGQKRVIEVQLRTVSEHRWAEVIMATGDQLGYSLRDGKGPDDLLEYFRLASHVLALMDEGSSVDKDLRTRFAAAREQVRPYFTPKETG
jgi:ppGpp synthetase/RelA/SpoT-type nucleotidyltranferase